MQRVYFDYNATTPMRRQVVAAMLPYLHEQFGNPSSTHWYGQQARRAVDDARRQVARAIGAEEGEVFFVSGGTESDNLALCGVVEARTPGLSGARPHVVTSAVEHPAVLATCEQLRRRGVDVTQVGVGADGRVDPDDVERAITSSTVLVSLMLANNDVGTLQPVEEVACAAREHGVLVHTDAVQALGKVPVDLRALSVDLMSLSAHKIGGPKGVGALVVRRGVEIAAQITGGEQERGRRGGTENVAAIAGFGQACELVCAAREEKGGDVAALRDRLEQEIGCRFSDARVNGHPQLRLPNTLSVTFPGIEGAALVRSLDLAGVACSVGSACASGRVDPSHVLLAMGLDEAHALATVRFSLGADNQPEEIDATVAALERIVPRLRELGQASDEAARFGRAGER